MSRLRKLNSMVSADAEEVQEHCCLFVKLKLAQSRLCRPCFTKDKFLSKAALAQNDLKKEYRVDHLLKKVKVLEGIVRENVLQQDEL